MVEANPAIDLDLGRSFLGRALFSACKEGVPHLIYFALMPNPASGNSAVDGASSSDAPPIQKRVGKPKRLHGSRAPHVALLIESSRAYGRDLLIGTLWRRGLDSVHPLHLIRSAELLRKHGL